MEKSFGAYLLGEPLGTLPFGDLVAATHSARSESLALLLLDPQLSGDHRFRGLVRLEMARAGGLRQAGVARMVEISEQSGALAVVYERPASGTSLAARLENGDGPDLATGLRLIRRLAEALDAAHSRRIVHGVLGPESVLIGADGSGDLVGVGLLAAAEEAGLRGLILARADARSLAPEQQTGKLAVASADGFALAILAERVLGEATPHDRSALGRQRSPQPTARFSTCVAFSKALEDGQDAAGSSAAVATPASAAAPAETPAPTYVPPPVRPAPAAPWTPPAPAPLMPEPQTEPHQSPTVSPAPTMPLPWSEPLAASADAPFATPDYARPPGPPAERTSALPPTAPLPQQPVAAQGQTQPINESLAPGSRSEQWSAGGIGTPPATPDVQAVPPTVRRSPPTPAMLAFQKTLAQGDLGTALVLGIASRVAVLDRLADQYAPNGKIGSVPLGIAVALALAVLLLLLRQPIPAAILVMLVVGLYVMPRVVGKLVASEQPAPEAVRVQGSVSIRKRSIGTGWDTFEVDINDGVPLSLPASGYRRLASVGRPVTVEQPTAYGPEQVTVAHELHGVTLTYFVPGRHLLDVRDDTGVVIYRHPDYAGEPGDRISLDVSAGESGVAGNRTPRGERPEATPTWRSTPYGHRIVLPMPAALATELQAAFKTAATTAAVVNGLPLAVLIVSAFVGDFGFFALMVVFVIFMFIGAAPLMRAIALHTARHAESIVQVAAPASLQQVERRGSKGSKSQHYTLRLDDGRELKIQQELFDRLAKLGRKLELHERPGILKRVIQSEETVGLYDVQGSTVTYEPSSDLLLEVLDAGGNTVYRDSAITPRSIGGVPPRQT